MSKITRSMVHNFVNIDSFGDCTLTTIPPGFDSTYENSIFSMTRPLIKIRDKYLTFHYWGESYGEINHDDSSMRKLDILVLDSVTDALASQAPDSALEVLGVRHRLPVLFDIDSTHSPFDSNTLLSSYTGNVTLDMTADDSVYSSLYECFDRTYYDSIGLAKAEGFVFDGVNIDGYGPQADSSISYDSDFMYYNDQAFSALDVPAAFYVEESGGSLVARVGGDSEYNTYQSYIDSVGGIDVIYWNDTQGRWEERNFSDDSGLENWTEGFSFSNTGVTAVTSGKEVSFQRNVETPGTMSRFIDFLRDGMGMYHFPSIEMALRIREIVDSSGGWQGSFDSLGAPWSTWRHADKAFGPRSVILGSQLSEPSDSYKPLPVMVFTTY